MESWNGPASLLFTVLSLCSGPGSQAVSHSLMYFYLQSVNISDLPDFSRVGMLDDLQIDYYDSTLEEVEARQQWIADGFSAEYWKQQKEITDKVHQFLSMYLKQISSFLSISYIQGIWGCTQSGNMSNTILKLNVPDIGEIICDIATEKCTGTGVLAMFNDQLNQLIFTDFAAVNAICIQYLQRALQLGKEVLERQVAPELRVLTRKPTATEGQSLRCIITPFYPRAINATWLKSGQVVSEGYKETVLPNYNETYWMELIIELQDNDPKMYTCQVQHSSLSETLMLRGGNMLDLNSRMVGVGWRVLVEREKDTVHSRAASVNLISALSTSLTNDRGSVGARSRRDGELERTGITPFHRVVSLLWAGKPGRGQTGPLLNSSFNLVAGQVGSSHSLIYFYLHSISIPDLRDISRVGMLDDLQIDYYDNTLQKIEARQQWVADGFTADYWNHQKEITDRIHQFLSVYLKPFTPLINISYIQGLLGCIKSENTFNTFVRVGIRDFGNITCDLTIGKCTATGVPAILNDQLQQIYFTDNAIVRVVDGSCKQFLQRALQLVAPELQVLTRKPTATEGQSLRCIITPFYPRAINATWLKNGQVVSEGYKVTVLPNYNNTYWMELVIELQGNDPKMYTCQVQHSSLSETLMLKGGVGEPRGAGPMLGLMAVLAMVIGAV
ncbi:uncharacterized protein LOC127585964 [Pristis pectinata]|uniref:uncharacterized protein LOC127585964 n=1 Tax=Pristis pectinata TaxID=685728 RepID=UPI00223E8A12|nr:uncharacterized protein LOC127585964 [Pristis pectinata]